MLEIPSKAWSLATNSSDYRDFLAKFWLGAPSDQIQSLWASEFGKASIGLINQLTPDSAFTPEEVATRDAINESLRRGGLQDPLAPQLLLAVFLYSPPGLMQVANPDQSLPAWLADAYKKLYEYETPSQSPVPTTSTSPTPAAPTPPTPAASTPPLSASPGSGSSGPSPYAPDFGPFPGSLEELVGNRIHLNRILGLSNLYYIDPEDKEILQELLQLRTQLVQLVLQAPESSLQQIWEGDFGDRYWAMVRSGVQQEPLSEEDQRQKQLAVDQLDPKKGGGFGTPGAVNAFLVSMLFYLPGSMKVDDASQKLPAWLLSHYEQVFAVAVNAS